MDSRLVRARLEEIRKNLRFGVNTEDIDLIEEAIDNIDELINDLRKEEGV